MKRIVLLRHGESLWNQENKFTGWTDVDLSPKGIQEAIKAGDLLKEKGFVFDKAYTSYLKRAIKTQNYVLDRLDQDWIPVEKNWRLNEKHYGALQGLNKSTTAARYGDEQVLIWRRSYDIPAPALSPVERILPYWKEEIFPSLTHIDQILVTAHGNSLRGIIKYLKNISDEDIVGLNLPTAVPYVFDFDNDLRLINDYFLGDPEEIKKLMEAVAKQGQKK